MQLLLDTHGLVVKVRNRSFYISGKNARRQIGPEALSSIAVTADCLFSTAALRLAIENGIPVYLLGPTGRMEGKLWSPHFVGLAEMRRAQALWIETGAHRDWLPALALQKIRRQIALLQTFPDTGPACELMTGLQTQLSALAASERDAEALRQSILGLEGSAARAYWPALSAQLPPDWQFAERSRRPAKDPFNAALNYLYGMLYPAVEAAIFAVGLDPYMGILHAEEYDRPALAFDLIEPFRPWVDALLLELCRSGRLETRHFEAREGGCWAGKAARQTLIPAFNDFLLAEHAAEEGPSAAVRNHLMAFAGGLTDDIEAWYRVRKTQTD